MQGEKGERGVGNESSFLGMFTRFFKFRPIVIVRFYRQKTTEKMRYIHMSLLTALILHGRNAVLRTGSWCELAAAGVNMCIK